MHLMGTQITVQKSMHVPDFAFDPSITSSFNKKITENVGHIFQKVTKITTVAIRLKGNVRILWTKTKVRNIQGV